MRKTRTIKNVRDLERIIGDQEGLRRDETRPVLTVSAGTCGRARGSLKVIESLKKALRAENMQDNVKIRVTGCHGFCEAEPNIIIYPQDIFYQKVDPKNGKDIVNQTVRRHEILTELLYSDARTGKKVVKEDDIPFYGKQMRIVLGDNALIDPTDIDDYFSIGGYRSLIRVLSGMTPEEVIDAVRRSGLRGRGGAGFPTGNKWASARRAGGRSNTSSATPTREIRAPTWTGAFSKAILIGSWKG